jgi:FtsH-binding integral membrane protein
MCQKVDFKTDERQTEKRESATAYGQILFMGVVGTPIIITKVEIGSGSSGPQHQFAWSFLAIIFSLTSLTDAHWLEG